MADAEDETAIRLRGHYNTRLCQSDPLDRLQISRATLYRKRKRQHAVEMQDYQHPVSPDHPVQPRLEEINVTLSYDELTDEPDILDEWDEDHNNSEISNCSSSNEFSDSDASSEEDMDSEDLLENSNDGKFLFSSK